MKITKVKKFLPVIVGIVCLGLLVGYRITDHITENKVRAQNLAKNSQITVETLTAKKMPLTASASFSAGLEPEWIAEISAKVDGRVEQVMVKDGDWVESGTPAMVLENTDTLAQIMQAKGNLLAAQSNMEQAELDYGRYAALAKDGAVAAQTLDNARTKLVATKGQVQTAQGALALAEEKAANLNILVPRAGFVAKRHLQEGAFVRSGTSLLTVADTTTLVAKATIGEAQIAGLVVGTEVSVVVDALGGEEFVGMITMISPMADLPARTFTADIAIDNKANRLKAGMFAKVNIPLNETKVVVAIPESAIVLREDQSSIYVITDGNSVSQRVIKTGIADNGWIEVVEGLAEGEIFVGGGQNKLRDGMTVNLVNRGEQA